MTPRTVPDGPVSDWLADPTQAVPEVLRRGADLALTGASRVGPPAIALLVVLVLARELLRRQRAGSLAAGAHLVTIEVPPEVDPDGAVALWSNLRELLRPRLRRLVAGQPHLAFELAWGAEGLRLGLWVPGCVPPGWVEKVVAAAWPGARTTSRPPPDPLGDARTVAGGELRLAGSEWFPLATEHPSDPLRLVLGSVGGLAEGEAAAVQVLARPLTGRRVGRALRAAAALRAGRPASVAGRLLQLVTPGPIIPRPSDDPTRAADVRLILAKATSPAWEAVVRYGVGTSDQGRAARPQLRGRAHALASAFALFAGRNRLERRRLRRPGRTMAQRRLGRGDLVSVPELAALAHLPADVATPGLARAGAKALVPPPAVPREGKVLGDSEVGPARPVAIGPADARHHVHLLGATGSGKSTLLANLIVGDAEAERGAVVIDPKGDLVLDVLDRLPPAALSRLVLIDPQEADRPPALNVLEGADPDLVVDHVVGIFRRIFEAYWGPRTDDVLRSACLTLLGRPGASLADVPRLLANERFRQPYLQGLADPGGLGGFWAWYASMSEAERARVVGPVMNKLRAFLLRPFVRGLVGTATSSFSLADVLDGGLLLVRLPKGAVGDETARLVGSFVVAKVWQEATARARSGEAARVDASLYIDECHNFLTLPRSFEEMLAEARGYRLSLVLAHQHLGQLSRDLREAISANARNKVFFTTSPEDAHVLERHMAPDLGAHDLAHLGAYQAAARLVVAGRELPAFTLRTRPAPPAVPGRADEARAAARAFGRSADERERDEIQSLVEEGA